MAFQSMTGFSQLKYSDEQCAIAIELRSVNGKGLDFRLKFPHEFSHLDQVLRKKLEQKIQRGNLQGLIQIECSQADDQPIIDHYVLQLYLKESVKIANENGLEPPRIENLMALPGVVHHSQNEGSLNLDDLMQKEISKKIIAQFEKALDDLLVSRIQEGEQLIKLLKGQLDELKKLVNQAENDESLKAEVMKQRLEKQLALIMGDNGKVEAKLDGDRLYQEVAILINRADVREELDRLNAHILAIESHLNDPNLAAIGKKLDFLAQELNREANTLCSKSISPSLSAIGVALKTVIDQFREQVQNLQ